MQVSEEIFQKIASRPLPEPKDLIITLSNFHSVLYDAFGHSLARTREAVKHTHNKKSVRTFRPQAIRFYIHDFLGQKDIITQLVDENDEIEDEIKNDETIWKPLVLAGNGIAGIINGYPYRIFKMFNGGLPPPSTKPRKKYYSQAHLAGYEAPLPGLSTGKKQTLILKANLIYLWELVNKGKSVNLYLAVPKHSLLWATTKAEFIPNPLTEMKHIEAEDEVETGIQHGIEAQK